MQKLKVLLISGIAICSRLSAADDPALFPQLVDELERAETILADQSGKIVWRGHPTEIRLENEIERLLKSAAER